MTEVYEANDGVLGRRVAVKVFRGETDIATSQARQQLEIQALARLQHPNIVAVFDAGTDAGVSFVVMQLIDGVTLAERTRGSALAPAETARVSRAVADALAHVHSLGMVHHNIKPGNILCGANGPVFLTDFGIVRLIGRTRLTQTAPSARSDVVAVLRSLRSTRVRHNGTVEGLGRRTPRGSTHRTPGGNNTLAKALDITRFEVYESYLDEEYTNKHSQAAADQKLGICWNRRCVRSLPVDRAGGRTVRSDQHRR